MAKRTFIRLNDFTGVPFAVVAQHIRAIRKFEYLHANGTVESGVLLDTGNREYPAAMTFDDVLYVLGWVPGVTTPEATAIRANLKFRAEQGLP